MRSEFFADSDVWLERHLHSGVTSGRGLVLSLLFSTFTITPIVCSAAWPEFRLVGNVLHLKMKNPGEPGLGVKPVSMERFDSSYF